MQHSVQMHATTMACVTMDDAFAIRGGEVLLVLRLYPVKQDALDMDSAGTDIAFVRQLGEDLIVQNF